MIVRSAAALVAALAIAGGAAGLLLLVLFLDAPGDRSPSLVRPPRHANSRESIRVGGGAEETVTVREVEFDGRDRERGVSIAFGDGAAPTAVAPANGKLALRCDSLDPILFLVFDPPIPAERVTSVEALVVVRAGERRPQMRWSEKAAPGTGEWRAAPFPVRPRDEEQKVTVAVADLLDWRGSVRSIAIALPAKAGAVEIERIAFVEERTGLPHAMKAALGTEKREAHVIAPGSDLTLVATVEPGSTLRFGYGLLGRSWKREHGGGRLVVLARPDGEPEETIFAAELRRDSEPSGPMWSDAPAIPLARFGGRRVTFTFRIARLHEAGDDLAAIGLVASPMIVGPSARRGREPVIVVSLDTLRADHLPSYGYARDTAPRLDAIAKESALFEAVMSQAPETLASHMSLFTGQYPSTHQVANVNDRLAAGAVTLACRFREAGYHTVAVTEGGMIGSAYGFDAGFDRYDDGPPHDERGGGHAAWTFSRAAEIAETLRDVPLFLFVHTYQIHTPYAPPTELRGLYAPDGPGASIPGCDLADGFDNAERDRVNGAKEPPSEETARVLEALYDEEIRFTDGELGRFVDRLRAASILDRSVLAILSDHGEEFLDRGREHGSVANHGHTLNEEMVHVPLIVRAPGRAPVGVRISSVVPLVDLHPTLLEMADVAFRGGDLPARSLAPLLAGGTRPGAEEAISEDLSHYLRTALRTRDFRYVWTRGIDPGRVEALRTEAPRMPGILRYLDYAPVDQIYDRRDDPHERHDLAAERPADASMLRTRLEAWLGAARLRTLEIGCDEPPSVDQMDEASLEALGYIQRLSKPADPPTDPAKPPVPAGAKPRESK